MGANSLKEVELRIIEQLEGVKWALQQHYYLLPFLILESFRKKYVGVQSWKAAHLPTLEIRVEQKGNRSRL